MRRERWTGALAPPVDDAILVHMLDPVHELAEEAKALVKVHSARGPVAVVQPVLFAGLSAEPTAQRPTRSVDCSHRNIWM